jgi:CYTH domain-containing protein
MPAAEREEGLGIPGGNQPVFSSDSEQLLKYARIEQERRFLLKNLPRDLQADSSFMRIIDSYIQGTRLRLRRMEPAQGEAPVFKLGQKYRPADFEAHQAIMTNLYLNEAEYRVLESLGGARVTKLRYSYEFAGQIYAIDVFEEKLEGLILAEVEMRPGVQITSLPVPGFAIREVTGEPFFSGAHLAELGHAEFLTWLESGQAL